MYQVTILFLASNPQDTTRLKLDEELGAITDRLHESEYREVINLVPHWAVGPDDLILKLNDLKPEIIHFSGHGSQAGELMLTDQHGMSTPARPAALKKLFGSLMYTPRLVVLNTCYSEVQAKAIRSLVDCVIGMQGSVADEAARTFAASFYRALGFGVPVKFAFEQGVAAIMLHNLPDEDKPHLLKRQGINPAQEYLVFHNPEVDIIASNLAVARSMFADRTQLEAASRERKAQVTKYYERIARTLNEVIFSLRVNIYPHGSCEKMRLYAEQLPEIIGDLVGIEKANLYANKLFEAHNVEMLLNKLSQAKDREARLVDLEKAQAYFEVLADSLQASSL